MQLRRFILDGAASLEALYPPEEARSLVLRLCQAQLGIPTHLYITEPEREISPDSLAELQAALDRLQGGEPLQYVLGWAEFYGRRFRVSPDVLIPRPETEILVQEALSLLRDRFSYLSDNQPLNQTRMPENGHTIINKGLKASELRKTDEVSILDLCTGSGCIAWTLALEQPGAVVTGVDISEDALKVAREQFGAAQSKFAGGTAVSATPATFEDGFKDGRVVPPEFVQADVLSVPQEFPGAPFDLITANPPYIRECEKGAMHPNVLEHEPGLALFVPDDDPLLFYRAVAQWALRFLRAGGFGIVEINEALGEATAELFRAAGLKNVAVLPDLSKRDRFVSFCK